ncbi:TatD family nuclease-associated radical SAM protein [Halanaerobaculum tunisiense]
MTITYQLDNKLYINLTNQCSNDCKFCIKNFKDGVGGYNLRLDKEPTAKQVIDEIGDAAEYKEIVFCGYGEPLIRLNNVIKISRYLKDNYSPIPIRINTNGQANLIHNKNVVPELAGIIDQISISLNASNAETYQQICQSKFKLDAFPGVVKFIKEAKKFIPKVIVSVVDYSIVDVESCRELAKDIGVKFRLRHFKKN